MQRPCGWPVAWGRSIGGLRMAFDPLMALIGVLAAAIVVFLIRMLSQTNSQPAAAALRTTTATSGPPFAGQNLSDLPGKPPGPRPSAPRVEPAASVQPMPAASAN